MAHYYHEAGTKKTLNFRVGTMYKNITLTRTTQRKNDEARDLSDRFHGLFWRELSPGHHLTVRFEFHRAFVSRGSGDLEEALVIYKEAFERRQDAVGKENHGTLEANSILLYCINVPMIWKKLSTHPSTTQCFSQVYHNCRGYLRETPKHGVPSLLLKQEDIA